MDKAIEITRNWCLAKRLTVHPTKTKTIICTWKYKSGPIESLKLWRRELEYTPTVKYLGVHLDLKLNWKHYFEIKRNNFYASMWVCRKAMGKTWGIK